MIDYLVLFLSSVIFKTCLQVCIVRLCMATLTEVFPCFFLSCKANARIKPAKTGHGLHSSSFLCCMYCLFCVVLCIVFVCICVLYCYHRVATQLQLNISYHIISYHIMSCHVMSYHIISYHIISYHIISYHIISYHIISYHIISYHIISYHIISYHIISYIIYHIIS